MLSKLRVGILIVGSLLWDESPDRAEWREKRLDLNCKDFVHARTRYGRHSTGKARRGEYTLTFSGSANLSTAVVVPCRKAAQNTDEVFEEAEQLARAEGLLGFTKWQRWGAVGLLCRSGDGVLITDIKQQWPNYFQSRTHEDCIPLSVHGPGERPALTADGVLAIDWPICTVEGSSIDCDILLATANAATFVGGRYATPEEIARSCVDEAGKAEYFRNNVLAGIHTAEDRQIWQAIQSLSPEWASGEEYKELSFLLGGSCEIAEINEAGNKCKRG